MEVDLFSLSKKTSKNFNGKIRQTDGKDIQTKCLKIFLISKNVYVWPNQQDVSWEKQDIVLKKLIPPEIIKSRLEIKFMRHFFLG